MTAGKGSNRRPTDTDKFNENFDRIFCRCEICGEQLGNNPSAHKCYHCGDIEQKEVTK